MGWGGYRPNSGPKKGTKYKPRVKKANADIKAPIIDQKEGTLQPESALDPNVETTRGSKDSLECLQEIFSDKSIPIAQRIQAAGLALQFQHPRIGEGKGKKEEKEDRAKAALSGRFAPGKAPLRVVK